MHTREIHVAKTGDDRGHGTSMHPFRTINRAAAVAEPGDTITVHEGTYREWVKPVRGGLSDDRRITYRAAPGERVFLKGSERITSWVRERGNVWRVELPASFFGEYNPYALTLSGGWLEYGHWHHRGDVHLDGEALREKQTPEEVIAEPLTWHCEVRDGVTTIRATCAS